MSVAIPTDKKLLKPLKVSLKNHKAFGITEQGMLKSFGKWDEYIGKRKGNYVLFPFRALSENHIGATTSKSMKFRDRGVIRDAFNKGFFNELPVYLDHEMNDTRTCVGIVFDSALAEPQRVAVVQNNTRKVISMPYGVDVLIGVHYTELKLIDNIRTGAVSCVSMTMYTHFVRSHDSIPVETYHEFVGKEGSDGEEVYREAVFIESTEEISILRKGADKTAVKYLTGEEANIFSLSAVENTDGENFKKVTILDNSPDSLAILSNKFYICLNDNSKFMSDKKDKRLTILGNEIVEVDALNKIVPDSKDEVVLTAESLVMLEDESGALVAHSLVPQGALDSLRTTIVNYVNLETELLNDLRESIKKKYVSLNREIEPNVKVLLETANRETLTAFSTALGIQLNDDLTPFCMSCQSGDSIKFGRQPLDTPPPADDKNPVDKTTLSEADELKIARFRNVE